MKIIGMSDTHMGHRDVEVPNGDILIHSGDCSYLGAVKEVVEFADWFNSLPHKTKIFVPGNHDFLFQREPVLAREIMKCCVLIDEQIVVNGLTIYGSPWTPRFMDWAFMKSGSELAEVWNRIPLNTDILVTHGPPYKICDCIEERCDGRNLGCMSLLERVNFVKPKVHIFGHIHGGHGQFDSGGTKFFNASVMDENYMLSFSPFVLSV